MTRARKAGRAAALLVLPMSGSAWAHAFLAGAVPPVGATVPAPPTAVELRFTEAVEPSFSHIEVEDAAGRHVETGPAATAPDDGTRLIVPIRPAGPGDYTVTWHVVSVDTHRTEGRFHFTVAAP